MSTDITTFKPTEKQISKFNEVCDLIASKGISVLTAIKQVKGIGSDTFYLMLNTSNLSKEKYTHACEIRAYGMAEQSCSIFDDVEELILVNGRHEQNHIGLAIAKAKAENLKWYASKLNKALSDKGTTNIQINNEQPTINIAYPDKL